MDMDTIDIITIIIIIGDKQLDSSYNEHALNLLTDIIEKLELGLAYVSNITQEINYDSMMKVTLEVYVDPKHVPWWKLKKFSGD